MGAGGRIDLVVTDLDGTLWDWNGILHPRAADALAALEREGIPILAATARRERSAVAHFEQLGLDMPVVLLDGSLGRYPSEDRTFHRRVFDTAQARTVLHLFEAAGIEPCINVDDARDVIIGPRPSTHPISLRYLESFGTRGDLVEVVATSSVLSFQVYGLAFDRLAPLADALGAFGGRDGVEATLSRDRTHGNHGLTVRPPGVTKWDGVVSFCMAGRIDPARTLAIGDGENDVELLRQAGASLAPAGASDAAKEVADHVVGWTEDGSWAAVLDHLG